MERGKLTHDTANSVRAVAPSTSPSKHAAKVPVGITNFGLKSQSGAHLPINYIDPTGKNKDISRKKSGSIDPKVFVPHQRRTNESAPREVEVERKKRLYASVNLQQLMREKLSQFQSSSIYHKVLKDASGNALKLLNELDIAAFDDDTFEEHAPNHWIQLGTNTDGSVSIPVSASIMDPVTRQLVWWNAEVLSFDSAQSLFEVRFLQDQVDEIMHLPRLCICFKAEDPFNFADRVKKAHFTRLQAQDMMRKALYVDCMPVEELHKLGTETLNRMFQLATTFFRAKNQQTPDTTTLIHEVQIDFLRSTCKTIFEFHHRKDEDDCVFRSFLLHDEVSKACSIQSKYNLPFRKTRALPVDYSDEFVRFSFHSIYTSPEALYALTKVSEECQKILQLELFNIKAARCYKLEEFQQQQQALENSVMKIITEDWPQKIVTVIKSSFASIGKGWYYLQESQQDTYEFSKLRSLLRRIHFLMRDTLRYLMYHSLHSFCDYIKHGNIGPVHIISAKVAFVAFPDLNRDVIGNEHQWQYMCQERQFVFPTALFSVHMVKLPEVVVINQSEVDEAAGKIALWEAENLKSKEGSATNLISEKDVRTCPIKPIAPKYGHLFGYSTTISRFRQCILTIFMRSFDNLRNIKQIEQKVMNKLFWSSHPCIPIISSTEDWVEHIREQMEFSIKEAEPPLREYLMHYQPFVNLINMDEDEYTKTFQPQKGPINISLLQETIQQHLDDAKKVEETLPTRNIELGMFSVNCSSVRQLIAEKYRSLARKLLDWQLENCLTLARNITDNFELILRQLQKTPSNIEELSEMSSYLNTVSAQIAPLLLQSQLLIKYRLVLDHFRFSYDRDDFMTIWRVRISPIQVNEKVKQMTILLEAQKTQFFSEMKDQQAEFTETLRHLHAEVDTFRQYTDLGRLEFVYKSAVAIEQKIAKVDEDARVFKTREQLFGQETTSYDDIQKIRRHFDPYALLWRTANNWIKEHKKWMDSPFMDLNGEEIESFVESSWGMIQKAVKHFEKAELKGCMEVANTIRTQIAAFRPHVPLILALRNPGMKDRHWTQMNQEIKMNFRPDRGMRLSYVLDIGLERHLDSITRICETSGKEFTIEKTLSTLEEQWRAVQLQVVAYRETGTFVLKGVDEIQAILDEQITTIQAVQFSAFKKPFEDRINRWGRTLSVVSDVMDEWMHLQRSWIYLQPIFDSPDITKQLPTEGKRFATVDKHWRQTLANAYQKPGVLAFCNNDKFLDRLIESNRFLDQVQKGLNDFLETKRAAFSRFYFLSNEELLSILSESKDVKLVQPHLKKCFEGIVAVDFGADSTINAMISAEGESVALSQPVNPKGKSLEHWMTEVEVMMRTTIRDVMHASIQDYVTCDRVKWIQKWPGMCVLNASQLHWTREMEESMQQFGQDGVKKMMTKQLSQLADMIKMVRGPLNQLARITVGALTVIDVHARDVTWKLTQNKVESKDDFMWSSQLRYYWENDLLAEMVSAKRPYGYEYLGNSFRLVITPLTDKCYMTLMAALQMILGGAPAGPAGTGKTETTKDLAKALAKQCVVFNCSDGLDYLAMGKFFKGLAACGAWACFDEFNRINIEVLSVIGQQITTLQLAIRANEKRIFFEGSEILVSPQFGVFITMNPGYAGRSDLPDSLAALFRPVAMMVPDYAMIGEIMFFAYGYEKAKQCGAKMVTTFKLCSEQLSSQAHYDYGMRAVKTVITAAGNYKQQFPELDEEVLLLKALQHVNMPKFLAHDIPLFNGLISDLFPDVDQATSNITSLDCMIKRVIQRKKLQAHQFFLLKTMQLYETIRVRHGLMVVGGTGGGKSCNIDVLAEALSELKSIGESGQGYEYVRRYQLNPKAITMGQLYGEFDANTHEWQDGILSTLYRQAANDTKSDRKWIIFDGPVDALWIENMNTVLDDNKKLCLSSGEIIQMSNEMTMMFEVEDLSVASPATVSRTGMVYMEPSSLGLDPLIQSWLENLFSEIVECSEGAFISTDALFKSPPLKSLPTQLQAFQDSLTEFLEAIIKLSDRYINPSLEFIAKFVKEWVPQIKSNVVQSLFRLLGCFLMPIRNPTEKKDRKIELITSYKLHLESLFMFSLIWSLGAGTTESGRSRFDTFIREEMASDGIKPLIPAKRSVYDYSYDTAAAEWVPWIDMVSNYSSNMGTSISEIVVPTSDSIRCAFLMNLGLCNNIHMLFVGPTGTGKTVNINQFLERCDPEKFTGIKMSFSAQTSANQTQDYIDSKLEKRRKNVYGPSAGKTAFVYVDDLNMPKPEEYFAQPAIEILRQWFDQGGWYDRKTLAFRSIVDIVFVSSMGPPGGGRNTLSRRLLRHFNIIGTTEIAADSKKIIFETILSDFCQKLGSESLRAPEIISKLVDSSIDIYNIVSTELLPTPAKSHYTFNLRDLAKVFQGVRMADPGRIVRSEQLVRLWVHELMRVFEDRFTTNEDHMWFQDVIKLQVLSNFEPQLIQDGEETDLEHRKQKIWDIVHPHESLLFGDYLSQGEEAKCYEEISDLGRVQYQLQETLLDYNTDSMTPMYLVMFKNAIEHVSRISRIIRQPCGNALLLGVGGSGRQSLTRLAAFMADYTTVQIEVSKGYGVTEWRDDLKKVLLKSGLTGKSIVFLFSDAQIIYETMLEDINNVLNSGDIPNLYTPEDLDQINAHCRSICAKKNLPATKINMFAQYLILVRQNLHVVLCMSPLGSMFRERLRMFPSLVNCCTIDWFTEWPAEALESVAASSLSSNSDTDDTESEESLLVDALSREALKIVFSTMHQSVEHASQDFFHLLRRKNYVTPASYLELLNTFRSLLTLLRGEVSSKKTRLQNGVDKIITTKEQVARMQQQLVALKPQLEITKIDVEALMNQITLDKKDADKTKSIIEKDEQIANKKAADTAEIASDAQQDLDEALPALDAATQCLNKLRKSDIDEVKALKNPPHGVKLTMEAACIIFGVKPATKVDPEHPGQKIKDYWESAQKTILGNAKKLLDDMLRFDKDNINEKIIQQIDPFIDMEDFSPTAVRKASVACEAICMWVRAMHTYHNVSKLVEPKKLALATAQAELDSTLTALANAKSQLQGVVDRLSELEKSYNAAMEKKEQLILDVQQCESRLESALKLIGLLHGEESRWAATIAQLRQAEENLIGDVAISAGTICYLGPFTMELRERCLQEWYKSLQALDVPFTKGCGIISTLADPVKVRSWQLAGLPSDTLSLQNGIIMARARRWPLLIDPQGQANRFIKNLGKDTSENGIEITDSGDKQLNRTLENAIRFGRWVLLENVGESLDATLEPILAQIKVKQGGQTMIKIGDTTVPYHPCFRFLMTTKLPNPHYPPEVSVKVTLLNFTITPKGLEDQALDAVVQEEMPALAEKKNSLVMSNARMKAELLELEKKILTMLNISEGNILDDKELLQTLGTAKVTSEDINDKMCEAEITERSIDDSRNQYRPVAFQASLLFFCIADLALVNPMYQYSLPWFFSIFVKSIRAAAQSDQLEERLRFLNDSVTYIVYRNICRSLFEEHKLLLSFLMAIKLLQGTSKDIDPLEWRFLISGTCPGSLKDESNPNPSIIDNRMWREICALSSLPAFSQVAESIRSNTSSWRNIFDSLDPQKERLPGTLEIELNAFQRLCILRCIRPDRMMKALQQFVLQHLGQRFIESPPFDLSNAFSDTTVMTPIIFILSSGSDPAKEVLNFAASMKMSRKFSSISLGQGQGVIAARMISEAVTAGRWILLQNCHLAVSWMPQLERICEELNPDTTHRDYRLWLTSRPCAAFPTSVLQNGVKITKEPPKGIRANLKSSYSKLTADNLQATSKPKAYQKLLFALNFFHAIVIERKRFGPLGWNIPYAFNDTDYDICRSQLEMFLDMYDDIPYKVLCVMTSVVNYGGRVTDDKDMRTIDVISESYFRPSLLQPGFKFSESGSYHVPSYKAGDDLLQSHIAYIDQLPLNSEPEVFGLHENANITCAISDTFTMFDIILSLQPRVSTASGQPSQESIIEQQASLIEKRLPPLFPVEQISVRYPILYEESMNTVLLHEVERYNALLEILHVSLPSLQKALRGLIVMSPELETTATCIFNQKVPPQWEKKAYPSLKALGGWFQDFLARIRFLATWIECGSPICFWLPGLFFPQGFLTGVLQNHARQSKVPIDSLSFRFIMIDECPEELSSKPKEGGCYIHGLFLEGARWDKESRSLTDPAPKELFATMPVIHLCPERDRIPPQSGIYRCPVYKILTRTGTLSTTGHSTNFVMWIEIPSHQRSTFRNSLVSETNVDMQVVDQECWIKAGVACFLSLRY
ncbi:unnamed protein product [Albugo candida]|uniref:AAA+ ATPase domain-containing protein n=1 Tax=Albugo candida TaxID=65357 RepID=A0A024GEF2_9STRA|nr:unnamed protein product [Albugo candida]|eukprot:CCI45148.1 unnamed protein product [Albugo candida]